MVFQLFLLCLVEIYNAQLLHLFLQLFIQQHLNSSLKLTMVGMLTPNKLAKPTYQDLIYCFANYLVGFGKLWPVSQFQPVICFYKVLLENSQAEFVYVLSITTFVQWQS